MAVRDRFVIGSTVWAFALCVEAASAAPQSVGHLAHPVVVTAAGDGVDASMRSDAGRQRGTVQSSRDANVAARWWVSLDRWGIEARTRYEASIPSSGFLEGLPAAQRMPQPGEIEALVGALDRLTEQPDVEIASQAIIALARTGAVGSAALRERALARFGAADCEGTRAAAIALCIADDPAARAALRWLVDADPAEALSRKRTALAPRDRAFAALALGVISDGADLDRLLDLACSKLADRDLRGLALQGVARLIERDGAARGRALPRLYALLDDARDSRSVRSLMPAVLVRGGERDAVLRVVAALRESTTIVEVRRAAAFALGGVVHCRLTADEDDASVLVAVTTQLLHSARLDRDAGVRQGAIAALDASTAIGAVDALTARAVADFHRHGVADNGVNSADTACRLLAAGRHASRAVAERSALVTGLCQRVSESADPDVRAAAARALGLSLDVAAIDTLRQRLGAEADPAVTAAIIDALGSLHDFPSRGTIERLSLAAVDPRVRIAAARATALLAGPHTVDVLLRAFDAARDERERMAVARALGALGDARALAPLEHIAFDPSRSRVARAQAVLALGLVVDPTAGEGLDALRAGVLASDAPDAVREWLAFERP
ncbi:MAG: HEAT repeat domain-containing protein [Planctomycetes bacterium]|nr:HEAT repeat domain-containing protein [Planctomycetota bacterium]